MAGKFGAFIAGGIIGAVGALLIAPRPGRETRAMVCDMANDMIGGAQDWGEQATSKGAEVMSSVTAKSQVIADEIKARSQSVVENVQEAAGNIKPVFTEKNDELREKIEAARRRIAEQVAKNAAESAAVAEDVVEAEVEVEETEPAVEEEPASQQAAEA